MDKLSQREFAIVNDLAELLRKNGEQILNGSTQFCLTTQSLSQLNHAFRRYSETKYDFEAKREGERSRHGPGRGRSQAKMTQEQEQFHRWRTNAQFLNDFITKTASLKITHGSSTMQGPILIARFKSLRILELKKIPTHMLEGLHKLRGQLQIVTVTRCLHNLQEFLETCGGDQSSPMSWPQLTSAYFSYNWITKLDASLRLLPSLTLLDLSHNSIDKVENYIEYLTELRRINLGYNLLDLVPTFSITVQSKLQTLVIRNNNLDNLSGVETLLALEEIDASENCLIDHSCLGVFNKLHSLRVVSLQGNPLCYHQLHRIRSLHHMSSKSLSSNQIVLDGKPVKPAELQQLLSTGKIAPEQPSERPISSRRASVQQRLSQHYKFEDTDDIAESVKVGSPSKRKNRRKKSRGRSARSNTEGSEVTETTDQSSPESSRVPSPTRIVEGQASTREEIEVLRDHYGVNWLQVISAKEYDSNSEVTKTEEAEDKQTLANPELKNGAPVNQDTTDSKSTNPTEDDIYLNESTADVHKGSNDLEDDIEVLHVSNGTETSPDVSATDLTLTSGRPGYNRMNSSKGAEWDRDEEENLALYGEECEPFIVMLPNEDLQTLLVTLNQRYLIEKDIEGKIQEMLDLKCLVSFKIENEEVDHENLGDTQVPVFRAKFDYVRKDRRERVFIMESTSAAIEFENLLKPIMATKEQEDWRRNLLQCLKCSKEVSKQEADISEHMFDKTKITAEPEIRYQCPHCGSQMLIEATPVPPAQEPHSSDGGENMEHAPIQEKKEDTELSGSLTRPRSYAFNDIMSHSDIGKKLTAPEIPRSNSTGKALSEKQREEEGLGLVNSWSEMTSSEQAKRKSRNSVDSDISVITNPSDASISVISESSVETISEPANEQNGENSCFVTSTPQKSDIKEADSVAVPRNLNLNGIVEEEEITPVGSPLSNSICSSMVSSVYENSLSVNNEDQETSPVKDLAPQSVISSRTDIVNNNGDSSIYTQLNATEDSVDNNSSSYETCEQNSTQDSTSQNLQAVVNKINGSDSSSVLNDSGIEWLQRLDNQHHVDLSVVDHRVQLYLDMNVLEESESVQCCIRCPTVQYMRSSEFLSYLIFSTSRVLVIEISSTAEEENMDGLSCIENQPMTELCYVDIGLGYQSVRLEFDTMCSSYSFLIRDEERCKSFISLVTEIIQGTAFSEESKLEGISKFNASTLSNLQDTVWWKFKHNLTEDDNQFNLVKYLSGRFISEHTDDSRSVGLAVTDTNISLVLENHQWPLPRLQASLPENIRGQQFVLLDRQKINNIATIEVCQSTGAKIKVNFFNEESQEEAQWFIAMETSMSTTSLLKSVCEPWKAAFGVDMEITPTDFEEE
ncbi:serine/threonine-protein kinase 11-interacting protein-like isoform X2 [Crassostrea virginica]